jgi:DNA-directed RNA polymerase subunit RPC12/RpoP
MGRGHPDYICLSCGKAMRLAQTISRNGELPEVRTYDCNACGIVFTEGAGRAEWRESVSA